MPWPTKDPADVLDYGFSFEKELEPDETLVTATWSVDPVGLELGDDTFESTGKVALWISGGAAETTYTVSCRVTTSGGRTYERSTPLFVGER